MGSNTVPTELLEVREKIDAIDRKLLELLAERFALTHQVGLLKANLELEAVDTVREAQKLANLRALCEEYELNPDFVTVLFTSIMEEVVRNHRRLQEL
ncbi:MAG TPA: chorismate mutase [Gammaproteobacteria bacterium]|jgi:chorismate mutase|nr:chorismate mutase [Gammaproteobacteria bacterium]|tara:strand:- start:4492 stop:4785 length:294 start_codon:yes stop_codon:yes gene_type:complete